MVFKTSPTNDLFTDVRRELELGVIDLFSFHPENEEKPIVWFVTKAGEYDSGCDFKSAKKLLVSESLSGMKKLIREYFQPTKAVVVPPPAPKPAPVKLLTDDQFEAKMKAIGADCKADNADDPEWSLENCAYDLAECALHDPEILKYCQKNWPEVPRAELKYVIGDSIC